MIGAWSLAVCSATGGTGTAFIERTLRSCVDDRSPRARDQAMGRRSRNAAPSLGGNPDALMSAMGGKRTLDRLRPVLHNPSMRSATVPIAVLTFSLSACLYNPTISEEIAEKCGLSVNEYERIEASLFAGQVGVAVRGGKCRLTRTGRDTIEGTIIKAS